MSEAVGVDFGTLDALPLPSGLQVLLRSFRPGRAHTPPYPGSLAQLYHRHERGQAQQILGFSLPRLSALLEAGQVELVATAGVAEVVAPGRRGGSGPVTVLYLPDEEVLQSSLEEAEERGLSTVEVDYGVPWPAARPETLRSPGSGDATMIDVRGQHVGVQHTRRGRTRLAWQQRLAEVECNIAVYLPHPPVPAVELLVRCDIPSASHP
jgi:hypothetical protein